MAGDSSDGRRRQIGSGPWHGDACNAVVGFWFASSNPLPWSGPWLIVDAAGRLEEFELERS